MHMISAEGRAGGKGVLLKAGSVPLGQVALVGPEDLAVLLSDQLGLLLLRAVAVYAVEVLPPRRTLLLLRHTTTGVSMTGRRLRTFHQSNSASYLLWRACALSYSVRHVAYTAHDIIADRGTLVKILGIATGLDAHACSNPTGVSVHTEATRSFFCT